MKKRIAVFCFCLSALLLSGCIGPGPADWGRQLVGDYEIWRLHPHGIELVKRKSEYSAWTILEAEIYAVSWTEEVIFLQWEPELPLHAGDPEEPHGEISYYIFLIPGEELLGPFDADGFAAACAERGLAPPETWTIATDLAG